MDFDAAMQAHANWKIKLTAYAAGISRDKVDPVATSKDNVCILGQWLHGEAKTALAGRKEYADLIAAHADFHRQAATLVRQIDAGQQAAAQKELDNSGSAYRLASSKVIGLLMSLKSAAK